MIVIVIGIPQEEGIQIACIAYETFYKNKPPIPTGLLEQSLRQILQENSFQFNGKKLPTNTWCSHGQKNGSRIANIFMSKVETKVLSQSAFIVWKCYIDRRNIFSPDYKPRRNNICSSLNKQRNSTPKMIFWVKISEIETTFLDTSIFKGESLIKKRRDSWCAYPLQARWDVSIHTLYFITPTESEKNASLKRKLQDFSK